MEYQDQWKTKILMGIIKPYSFSFYSYDITLIIGFKNLRRNLEFRSKGCNLICRLVSEVLA